jgi:FADH2 O2-dependent halogenase
MIEIDADVAVLGSGFAGNLCAMILARGGLRPVVIDRASHPRFAIGESSTPIANFVLRDLSTRYNFEGLLPLAKYGSWQRYFPEVVSGLKRGFSYFPHQPQAPFVVQPDHRNELLVAASHTDEQSDTQWLRADVDFHFAKQLAGLDVPLLENTAITEYVHNVRNEDANWALRGERRGEPVQIRSQFVVDGTGEWGALAKALGITVSTADLATRSRAVFSHFRGLGSWQQWVAEHGAAVGDYPFCCDDAAQHQLLDGAWMWILRFNNGVTSAGFAIDAERFPQPTDLSAEQEWQMWLDRYPSVKELFANTTIVDPPGKILRSGILPRRAARAVGSDWAMLPNTAGFIDPLHSTGIAHSLCGVERLTNIMLASWSSPELPSRLLDYERAVFAELVVMDRLVHGCYQALVDFRLFVAYSMWYFAAATWYEHQRMESGPKLSRWFLNADDSQFVELILEFHRRVIALSRNPNRSDAEITRFERDVSAAIQPYNVVGLFHPAVRNMYRYTAPETP